MKSPVAKYLSYLGAAIGLTLVSLQPGCVRAPADLSTTYQIPWADGTGEYHLQNVDIPSFTDPQNLRGNDVSILVDPYVADSHLKTQRPSHGRFMRTADNVLIPEDFATLQATTVFAHYDRLRQLDAQIGTDKLIPARFNIGIQVKISESSLRENNAVYDADLDVLLVVPYTDNQLPITVNGGVLAHEHFHQVFEHVVFRTLRRAGIDVDSSLSIAEPAIQALDPMALLPGVWPASRSQNLPNGPISSKASDDSSKGSSAESSHDSSGDTLAGSAAGLVTAKEYNQFLLRAVNEGFADYWGWLYSNDSNFVGRSLAGASNRRSLQKQISSLPTTDDLKEELGQYVRLLSADRVPSARLARAYILGNQYAVFLRSLALGQRSDAGKIQVAKALVEALKDLRTQVSKLGPNEFLSPQAVLQPLVAAMPKVEQASCQNLRQFARDIHISGANCADQNGSEK